MCFDGSPLYSADAQGRNENGKLARLAPPVAGSGTSGRKGLGLSATLRSLQQNFQRKRRPGDDSTLERAADDKTGTGVSTITVATERASSVSFWIRCGKARGWSKYCDATGLHFFSLRQSCTGTIWRGNAICLYFLGAAEADCQPRQAGYPKYRERYERGFGVEDNIFLFSS